MSRGVPVCISPCLHGPRVWLFSSFASTRVKMNPEVKHIFGPGRNDEILVPCMFEQRRGIRFSSSRLVFHKELEHQMRLER